MVSWCEFIFVFTTYARIFGTNSHDVQPHKKKRKHGHGGGGDKGKK